MNASVQRAALALACTAFACSTGGGDASQHGESEGGSSSASSSGGGSGSSGGSASTSRGSSSGSSSGSGAHGSTGSDAAAGPDGGDSGTGVPGPCDIYQSGNTPCVAAHSTVRALYASYNGRLYQVQRVADNATKDIYPLGPGGYADSSAQDTFCAQMNCTISIIYDQSPQHNDLSVSPPATQIPNGGLPALADADKITMAGSHPVYGMYGGGGVAYRNNKTTGVAKGNEPEAMYMVVEAARYSGTCCFDYGNGEANGMDDGDGTMEAVYWGSDT